MTIRRFARVLLALLIGAALLSVALRLVLGAGLFGSTSVVDEVRPLTGFHGVSAHDSIDLVLKQSPTERVTVEAVDDRLAQIDTVVANDLLEVRVKSGGPHIRFGKDRGFVVTVEAPELSLIITDGSGDIDASGLKTDLMRVTMKGSGDVSLTDLEAKTLAVQISGSGTFTGTGRAATQGFEIDGSGDLDCRNLEGAQVAVMIRGSGDAHVHATEALQIDIGGSGDVSYRGAPRVSPRIHGSGSVSHE
jgi:hypothetical protein